ncbi:Acetylornithine deacetylase [Fulvivirga imtechensis AK7]|uniref:Acetylornithine deacetylase n=1 Tax=Fulvivirga imtechensis AK7 TaxID=1237149 RepID=L8JQH2_9BACT|nr:M20 family metallo-hydrolase [Fulvivirga imtechensis]ELR69622.1 Acetylornithine deacetylase [Fulvivirga imtechensis AK7]
MNFSSDEYLLNAGSHSMNARGVCIKQEKLLKTEFTFKSEAVELLKQLIAIPSFSREEKGTADLLEDYLVNKSIAIHRSGNNVWAFNTFYDANKPTILLNSHHDTVKPNTGYTKDPFGAEVIEGKLYGLGANDAGGALVALMVTFLEFYNEKELPWNLIFAATAEEEISGKEGIEKVLPDLGKIDLAIVGEPTLMELAVAEKGLLVLDCAAKGMSGHAARNEGENAIYKAMKDINWFENYHFPKISETLGPVHMNVTQIQAGTQHNVVPDNCSFVVDIRVTDAYTHEEVLEIIKLYTRCEVRPRSVRLKPSGIDKNHPIVKVAEEMNMRTYGSPTLSDQALIPYPSVKIGPGDSARSHSADEFIYIQEIEEGVELYKRILSKLTL